MKAFSKTPRKAFQTRKKAFQLELEKAGIQNISDLTPGKRVQVRENTKRLLREQDLRNRFMVYAAFLVLFLVGALIVW